MNVNKIVAIRLFWAWLVLSLFTGGIVYYFETERIDEKVLALAIAAEQRLSHEHLARYNKGLVKSDEIQGIAQELGQGDFAVIEIYDKHKRKIVDLVPEGREALENELKKRTHGFPLGDEIRYEKYWLLDEFVLMVLAPIADPAGQVEGYFEGVYVAKPETLAQIREDVLSTILIAMAVILATTLLLYPVIMSLNREVIRQSRALLRGNVELLEVLGSAIAKRDSDTNIHNYRVTLYSIALGEAIGMGREPIRDLIAGAFLHDVGKIGISDSILLKPGRLTADEFEIMKTHVDLGVDIIAASPWLHKARDVVQYHHEKFDGSGYMGGLAGEAIPLAARVFAVVDVFDALTSKRPYKEPLPFEDVLATLQRDAGSHFDPKLVSAFKEIARPLHETLTQTSEADIVALLRAKAEHYFFF